MLRLIEKEMRWIKKFNCEILIKVKSKHWVVMRELANFLEVDNPEEVNFWIHLDKYDLHIQDNEGGFGPCYYYDRKIDRNYYFDYIISFHTSIGDFAKNVSIVKEVLEYFWEKGIPAAVDDFDYAEKLPLEGGNKLEDVFWVKDQFPDGKIPPVVPDV